ncbi:DNA cytosine methyltransferase [Tsuneonella sp. HG222]
MRLLDLFCCAGGAGMGYHQAGFEVVGVDIRPQPRYPFEFIQADCLTLDPTFVASFDVIHASPPCQAHTALKAMPDARVHADLIPATRAMLRDSGLPYVIENVVGAPLCDAIMLCGTMFGLGAQGCELHRHRLFESNIALEQPVCQHEGGPVVGVYGGHARKRSAKHGGRGTRDIWEGGHKAAASAAMGIDWMTLGEMSEAIPPAYTEWLGGHLAWHVQQRRAA